MDPSDYPPNSQVSKRLGEDKNVERVTSSEAIRKKKSIGRRAKEIFIAGDVKSSIQYGIVDVFIPEIRDTILDALFGGLERLFLGERGRRRPSTVNRSPYGNVQYTDYSGQYSPIRSGTRLSSPQRAMSRMARARHDFDAIVLTSRTEAEEVIDRLFDLISRYNVATLSDLYDLVGIPPTHTDQKWGWTDFRGAGVTRVEEGYLLDLPDPQPL